MSEYGLRVKDAVGNIILNNSDLICRFRHSEVAAAEVNGSVVLADIDGLDTVEFSHPINSTSYRDCEHTVSRSGTTINWTYNKYQTFINSVDSIIFVFMD